MAASAAQWRRLMKRLEPRVAREFRATVDTIKKRARIAEIEAAVANNDIDRALQATGLRDAAWGRVAESVRSVYAEAGRFTSERDLPQLIGADFNMSNPRARQWIERHSSELIVEISRRQRLAVMETISAGFQDGRNPRSIALDITGRMVGPRRTGGVIGLHEEFAGHAINARRDLETLSSNYFTRARRDRRFDSLVRRAINTGTPLKTEQVNRMVASYENRLLGLRGEMVARTETMTALNAGSNESVDQVIEEGLVPPDAIEETWDSSGDSRTRATHQAANGQTITHGEIFTVGGYPMRYPGDSGLGAPASEVVACRCFVRRKVDFSRVA